MSEKAWLIHLMPLINCFSFIALLNPSNNQMWRLSVDKLYSSQRKRKYSPQVSVVVSGITLIDNQLNSITCGRSSPANRLSKFLTGARKIIPLASNGLVDQGADWSLCHLFYLSVSVFRRTLSTNITPERTRMMIATWQEQPDIWFAWSLLIVQVLKVEVLVVLGREITRTQGDQGQYNWT